MAYAKIIFENEKNLSKNMSWIYKRFVGTEYHIRKAPVGFSWTTLFGGWLIPGCRGDFKWMGIMLLCAFIPFVIGMMVIEFNANIGLSILLSIFIFYFIFPFIYNKIYIKELIKKGFKAESLHSSYPSAGIDSLDSLLDSLSTKWNMKIPRLETENIRD